MISVGRLYTQVATVCPVIGVSIGKLGDSTSVQFQPDVAATAAQIAAAQTLINNFDWSDVAQLTWEDNQEPILRGLQIASASAIAAIDTYLAIPTPTPAQVAAEVRALDQRQKQIIQVLLRTIQKVWK